ncbi:HEPN domain-containing protein [Candidatus Woesearchaeota archaeon]|nr:HEPN domain-containing protein [Candidatus Woesearchaeota archaeon]MBI2498988.1 HEPN domain-containing protein [Candidatus Woesearchaeota archaeon]
MVNIKWCCNQKDGIKLIEPNDNLAQSYLSMAENALGTMNREKNYNLTFAISACYYSMYYSLYAILMKLGVKCEIHSCTLEFMKFALSVFYSKEEIKIIDKAFDLRGIAQYYPDRIIQKQDSEFIIAKATFFIAKSKEILSKINEYDIRLIRNNLEKV